jgi:protein dithiol oxidoreductase (disulfide-forming)
MKLGKLAMTIAVPLLGLVATPAAAIDAGFDYAVLSPAQKTETRGKIEVIEFFWYKCPHCYQLDPNLDKWLKTLPKDVAFTRVPAVLSEPWLHMAKAYYAMEALGVADKLHRALFDAIHLEGQNLDSQDALAEWMGKHGVDKAGFLRTYNSFAVTAKANRAKQLTRSYRLSGVPTLAVQGRYTSSASMTGSEAALFSTLDQLIEMVRKDKTAR